MTTIIEYLTKYIYPYLLGCITVSIIFILLYFLFLRKKDISFLYIPEELYNKELNHLDKIIHNWIKEENERSSIIIDTIGYNQCFLGQISLINFKSIGINPEVKNLLDKCLIDTDDRRSFSNFLDLYREILIHIDPNVVARYSYQYFNSLKYLGPNVYTHDNKKLKSIISEYPWLWLLDRLANQEEVKIRFITNPDRIVKTDYSDAMTTGIPLEKMLNE